jgi:hypothetical protein
VSVNWPCHGASLLIYRRVRSHFRLVKTSTSLTRVTSRVVEYKCPWKQNCRRSVMLTAKRYPQSYDVNTFCVTTTCNNTGLHLDQLYSKLGDPIFRKINRSLTLNLCCSADELVINNQNNYNYYPSNFPLCSGFTIYHQIQTSGFINIFHVIYARFVWKLFTSRGTSLPLFHMLRLRLFGLWHPF